MRRNGIQWFPSTVLVVAAFAVKACFVPFDDYAEADLCDAGRDAGIDLRTARDPALRGCDAGAVPPDEATAGASGMGGAQ